MVDVKRFDQRFHLGSGMIDIGKELLGDILQHAHNIIQRSSIERLEKAYELAYLAAVQYRNLHPRNTWSKLQRAEYNELLIAFDIAKTDLMQFSSLRSASSDILY